MLLNKVANLWQDSIANPDFRFEIKAQELSIELVKALAKTGKTQKELAEELGWKPSRLSKVLHGGSNLTLRTLFDLCEALEIDFDIQLDGYSQLKQEIEIVKMKNEQLNQMISSVWRQNMKKVAKPQSQPTTRLEYKLVG